MDLELTVGELRGREPGEKPIITAYKGSTAHWPKDTFEDYTWYNVTLRFPANMAKPKVVGYRLIPWQETIVKT